MKKFYLLIIAACLSSSVLAQEKFELGKPNNENYRYLDNYKALKEYINRDKYPNFKLGVGTDVSGYLQNNSIVQKMVNKNFDETVAGNEMKMSSVVDGNGNMNFTTVKNYVNKATSAGLNVYGHTLAWHSQQPIGWLSKLIAGKPDPNGGQEYTVIASRDYCTNQTNVYHVDEEKYGYSISFSGTDGLKVHCTKKNTNSWDVQFIVLDNIQVETGKTYKMTMTVKGSTAGKFHSRLGDWAYKADPDIPFTTDWKDVEVNYTATMNSCFFLLQCGDFVGDVYIRNIKFEGNKVKMVPLKEEEMRDTLVYAMDKWIKGMMNACNGKVKAWDLVNEAVGGRDNDGDGYYDLQHATDEGSGSWDVGGDKFYWQDYMGDIDYVREACRLARQYGPEDIKLFINDYNLEGTWDLDTREGIKASKKLWALVNWIKKWEADGETKIDGIGTQMHINCYENDNTLNNLKTAITGMFKLMAKTGKYVRVSELDMGYVTGSWPNEKDVNTGQITEAQHKKMADFYRWIIEQYLSIVPPAQQWGICQWCATDNISNGGWRANTPVGIWDANYYRKHVYAGFVRGLNEGDPSAIEGIEADKSVDTSKGIYNLNGMRLSATSLDELPAGLYIINGKKVVK